MLSLLFSPTDNRLIPTEIRKQALDLQRQLEFDDEGGDGKSFIAVPADWNAVHRASPFQCDRLVKERAG